VIFGYGIQGTMLDTSVSNAKTPLQPIWNIDVTATGERILGWQDNMELSRQTPVPVHVRGDATVMYKFLNPNLLTVVTETVSQPINFQNKKSAESKNSTDSTSTTSTVAAAAAGEEGELTYDVDLDEKLNAATEDNFVGGLNLYIINAVSGQIVHQTRIKDGSTPVNFVQAENWVVMHYWNQDKFRYELYVVDLYESKEDAGPYKMLKRQFLEMIGLKIAKPDYVS